MSSWITYKGLNVPDSPTGDAGINLKAGLQALADRVGPSNFTATANPSTADDVTQGYQIGSLWLNTSAGSWWVCINNAPMSATWLLLAPLTLPILLPNADSPVFQVDTSGNLTLEGNFTISGTIVGQTVHGTSLSSSGNLSIQGPSSLDNGAITTDGSGDLTIISVSENTALSVTGAASAESQPVASFVDSGSSQKVFLCGGTDSSLPALSVSGGNTSLDNGLITTDGSGNVTVGGSEGIALATTASLSFSGGLEGDPFIYSASGSDISIGGNLVVIDGGWFSCDSGSIETNGSGLLTMTANPPLALTGVLAITTSTIVGSPALVAAQTALNALCAALGTRYG